LAEVISRVIQAVLGDLIPVAQSYNNGRRLLFGQIMYRLQKISRPRRAGGWRRYDID
jgi:hypothetical protein